MKSTQQVETRLNGLALSSGIAVARVCKFNDVQHNTLPTYSVNADKIADEISRFHKAVGIAIDALEVTRNKISDSIGSVGADIFATHALILQDEVLLESVEALIRESAINTERAVDRTLSVWEKRMRNLSDTYMSERASDFTEIKRRLLHALGSTTPSLQCGEGHCQKGNNRIIVAEELTPSLTVELNATHIMGFVTERGGLNSHAAILARALGIPAVTSIPSVTSMINCGAEIMVNGITGEVVLWPSEETLRLTKATLSEHLRMPAPKSPIAGLKVMANISIASDVTEALHMQAEGIGLYRTEIEMIAAGRLLSEDELYRKYLSVCEAIGEYTVTFRLLDVGSDKPLPFVASYSEENPALGLRGVRFLLKHPDLLKLQARALARVSTHCPIDVLYPMISDVEQFIEARRVFDDAIADMDRGTIRHGVMFEIPSACLQAEEIMAEADFGSIGSNDLYQYLFAVDRNNALVADDFDQSKPAFWHLIKLAADAGVSSAKTISICGEIGGDPLFIGRLLNMGITSLSMSCQRIPLVRAAAERLLNETDSGV